MAVKGSNGVRLGMRKVPRSPVNTRPFERLVLKSKQTIALQGDAEAIQRATLKYVMNMEKISTEEYASARAKASRYRQIRYIGSTCVVKYLSSNLHHFTPTNPPTLSDWEEVNALMYLNLDYKHEEADFTNPSWPMMQKDTALFKKGQVAKKSFKVPQNFSGGHWTNVNNILPAAKADTATPLTWTNSQINETTLDRHDINEAILITVDGLPRIADTLANFSQLFTANFEVLCYHHFALRTPQIALA